MSSRPRWSRLLCNVHFRMIWPPCESTIGFLQTGRIAEYRIRQRWQEQGRGKMWWTAERPIRCHNSYVSHGHSFVDVVIPNCYPSVWKFALDVVSCSLSDCLVHVSFVLPSSVLPVGSRDNTNGFGCPGNKVRVHMEWNQPIARSMRRKNITCSQVNYGVIKVLCKPWSRRKYVMCHASYVRSNCGNQMIQTIAIAKTTVRIKQAPRVTLTHLFPGKRRSVVNNSFGCLPIMRNRISYGRTALQLNVTPAADAIARTMYHRDKWFPSSETALWPQLLHFQSKPPDALHGSCPSSVPFARFSRSAHMLMCSFLNSPAREEIISIFDAFIDRCNLRFSGEKIFGESPRFLRWLLRFVGVVGVVGFAGLFIRVWSVNGAFEKAFVDKLTVLAECISWSRKMPISATRSIAVEPRRPWQRPPPSLQDSRTESTMTMGIDAIVRTRFFSIVKCVHSWTLCHGLRKSDPPRVCCFSKLSMFHNIHFLYERRQLRLARRTSSLVEGVSSRLRVRYKYTVSQ